MDDIICEFAETCELPSCCFCPVKTDHLTDPLIERASRHSSSRVWCGSFDIEGDYIPGLMEDQYDNFDVIHEWITLLNC